MLTIIQKTMMYVAPICILTSISAMPMVHAQAIPPQVTQSNTNISTPVNLQEEAKRNIIILNTNGSNTSVISSSIQQISSLTPIWGEGSTALLYLATLQEEAVDSRNEIINTINNLGFIAEPDNTGTFHGLGLQDQFIERKIEPAIVGNVQPYLHNSFYSGLDMETVWALEEGSKDTVIAVLDTGVFENKTTGNPWVLPYNAVAENSFPTADGLHGPLVSTFATGNGSDGTLGTCKFCSVMPIKVGSERNGILLSNALKGMWYAYNNNAHVMIMSWGFTSYSRAMQEAITQSLQRNISLVASAGNNGNELVVPAAYGGVVSVGAVTNSGDVAGFSNTENVSIYAPGENILVPTIATNTGNSVVVSGTSYSAALIGGIAGLMHERLTDPTNQNSSQVSELSSGRLFAALQRDPKPVIGHSALALNGIIHANSAITAIPLYSDQTADIVTRDLSTGEQHMILLNNSGQVKDVKNFVNLPDQNWELVDIDDTKVFKYMLWRNKATGEIAMWSVRGNNLYNGFIYQANPGTTWNVLGLLDSNDSGIKDIYWYNSSTGQTAVWELKENRQFHRSYVASTRSIDWYVEAVSDFNNDKAPDFLWRNKNTGRVEIEFRNILAQTIFTSSVTNTAVPQEWKVIGWNDSNFNSIDDIYWRHTVTGDTAVWELAIDGTLAKAYEGVNVTTDWSVKDIVDINNDGLADYIWQHTNGSIATWIMGRNGTIRTGTVLNTNPTPTKQVAITGTINTISG